MTAAHTDDLLDQAVAAFDRVGRELGVDRRVSAIPRTDGPQRAAPVIGEPGADTRPRADVELDVFRAGLAGGLGDARDLPLDSHLHTVRSPDANAMLEAYCVLAVERGIAELAITDHVDFDPSMPAYGFASFADRERDVREAARPLGRPWPRDPLRRRGHLRARARGGHPRLARSPPARLRHRQRAHQRRVAVQGVQRRRVRGRPVARRDRRARTSTRSSGRPGPACSTRSATSTSSSATSSHT